MTITVGKLIRKLLAYHPDTEVRILSGHYVVTEPIEEVEEKIACKELGQGIGVEVVIQAPHCSSHITPLPEQPSLAYD